MNPNFIPVTERSNYKTKDIDMLDAKSISRVLSNCEEEIFTGYESSRGIYNEKLLRKYISFSKKINQEIYENGNVNLILIGAGTSGRLCRLMAKVLSPLDEANKYSEGKTAIIGFNPIHLATVDLGKKIQILNPVIGPEPIVGSVRMK